MKYVAANFEKAVYVVGELIGRGCWRQKRIMKYSCLDVWRRSGAGDGHEAGQGESECDDAVLLFHTLVLFISEWLLFLVLSDC